MIEIIPNFHPVFVHFTVALLSVGVAFYVLALVAGTSRWRAQWIVVARWCLWLGGGFAIVTAYFGWLAFNSVEHDEPAHAAMIDHRNWALVTAAVFVLLAAWSVWRHRAGDADLRWGFVVLLLVGQVMLASTAWHGAELVYRHGLGVISLPEPEQTTGADGHAHTHPEGDGHGH